MKQPEFDVTGAKDAINYSKEQQKKSKNAAHS
jgi:hypothetical protein